jgi:hypothetical protein
MYGRLKTAILGTAVVAAALVPLFGDPRQTPVTHPIWGRMLLRALDMTDAVRETTQASQVFATLTWRDSLLLTADRFAKSDGVSLSEEAGVRRVVAGDVPGEVVYPVSVVQGGDYQFRMRLLGDSARPVSAEIAAAGGPAFKTFTLVPASTGDWARAGSAHLDPGSYTASVLLPPGSALERVEVAPPCVASVEPVGGWHATAVTTAEDIAVTALRAIDLESELPPADSPIEVSGSAFEVDEELAGMAREEGFAGDALRAGPKGLRAHVSITLPEPGLYTVSTFGSAGAGQRWLADSCRKSIVCQASASGWCVVMSQPLSAGRHNLAVTLGDGAVVERIRIERKKDGASDYVATLRRIGFDAGPDGPVSRDRAVGALGFVRDKHRERARRMCGDPPLPEFTVLPGAQTQTVAAGTEPGSQPGGQPAGQAAGRAANPAVPPKPPSVLGPVLLPPQPPASPDSATGAASSTSQ